MEEYESVKEYVDRVLGIAHRVRLLGYDFIDSRTFEKKSLLLFLKGMKQPSLPLKTPKTCQDFLR